MGFFDDIFGGGGGGGYGGPDYPHGAMDEYFTGFRKELRRAREARAQDRKTQFKYLTRSYTQKMKGLQQLRARYGPLGIPKGVQNIHDQRMRQRIQQNVMQSGLSSAGSGFYSTSKPTTRHLVQSTGAVADLQAKLAQTYGPGREALETEYRLAPSQYQKDFGAMHAALPAYDPSRLMLPGLGMQQALAAQGLWQPPGGGAMGSILGGFGTQMGEQTAESGQWGSIGGLGGGALGGLFGGPIGGLLGGAAGSIFGGLFD